jgi:hypothetical protein
MSNPNFCLLIDELLAAWRVPGNAEDAKQRRIDARQALKQRIAELEKELAQWKAAAMEREHLLVRVETEVFPLIDARVNDR